MDERVLPLPLRRSVGDCFAGRRQAGAEFAIAPADRWQVAKPEYVNPRAPRQRQLLDFLLTNPNCTGAGIAAGFSRALLNKLDVYP